MLIALLAALTLSASATQDLPAGYSRLQLVLLHRGGVPESALSDPAGIQREHLRRLAGMNESGENLAWGPFMDAGDLIGVALLDVPTAGDAVKRFADDPYVKAGALTVEVRPILGMKASYHRPATYDVSAPDALAPFVFGFLVDGPNRTQDEATAKRIQDGHLAYMTKLHEQGRLAVAGPFLDERSPRGIVIYRVKTIEEARALASGDPAVQAGRLVLDAHPWVTLRGILP